MILDAARGGLRRAWALRGMVLFLLVANLLTAAVLAVPLADTLRDDLAHRGAAESMLYGFDYRWWSAWADAHPDSTFSPDVFGTGFAAKNLDLLLRGHLPGDLFVVKDPESRGNRGGSDPAALDPTVLALGGAYLVLQVFLAGGILGALRAPQPEWTIRGLLHGAGFYFGRLLRVAVLVLVAEGVVFLVYGPVAVWVDARAREAVSERTAIAWLLGRNLVLLLVLLAANMISSYAKILIVLEERSSALLALLSASTLCLGRLARTFGHVLLMALLALAGLAVWSVLDRSWDTVGYKTQVVTFVLLEGLVFFRLLMRVATWGGQVVIARRLAGGPAEAA